MRVPFLIMLALLLSAFLLPPAEARADRGPASEDEITEWQMMWEQPGEELTIEEVSSLQDSSGWFRVRAGEPPELPGGVKSAWMKVELPALTQASPALYSEELTARDVTVYVNSQIVMDSTRDYPYDRNHLLVPLAQEASSSFLYIKLVSASERLGQQDVLYLGEYPRLSKQMFGSHLFDLVLGLALMLIALFMTSSAFFLNKGLFPEWNSLSLSILSIGVMEIAYSPFIHNFLPSIGYLTYYSFDIASSVLLPALFYFFEQIFGKGPKGFIRLLRKAHVYIAIGSMLLFLSGFASDTIKQLYLLAGPVLFAVSALGSMLAMVVLLIRYCMQKNRKAIALAAGFSTLVTICIAEVIWYFASGGAYKLTYWKFGIIAFIISLFVMLVMKVTENYRQVLIYSKQLEVFNNELQRSEKIEMISQLAASVAHEVRNPLQVTRGFLQLLRDRTSHEQDKTYMVLAMDELDRASDIITDFLTFAKPGMEKLSQLNLFEELHQLKAIVLPLVTTQGGQLSLSVQQDLWIRGNSSKLKQAIINVVKNSVEALGENGNISIQAEKSEDQNKIVICIEDNGEGMEPEALERLGEPYYSQKTKGTGLGLMVTFRIIEAMDGRIAYKSEMGKGTQAFITFPAIN
nr:ATP-binding protein [Paenibacillus soyae]